MVHRGYESLWLTAALFKSDAQQRLADALFASPRYSSVGLHFNKGLAGAPPEAIASAKDTAMNPSVLTSFALAIAAESQGRAYPGIPGHQPSVVAGRDAANRINHSVDKLRAVTGQTGAYVRESNLLRKGMAAGPLGKQFSAPRSYQEKI
jgi:hypothetical protein